ncbi:MAG: hypothetical protein J2P25_12750 [Nocardiopsaceae bacterium]|nr:hypothetical protein [Nocardiopsaceae bacterium]
MEVIIGFAAGYWVGTRQGREGLQRALDAAREVYASPEARRLIEEGLTAAQQVAPVAGIIEKVGGNFGSSRRRAMIRDVLDEFVESRFGRQVAAAA